MDNIAISGDQDLLEFLSDEIKFEKDNAKSAPSIDSFQVKMNTECKICCNKLIPTPHINIINNRSECSSVISAMHPE